MKIMLIIKITMAGAILKYAIDNPTAINWIIRGKKLNTRMSVIVSAAFAPRFILEIKEPVLWFV